MPSRKFIAIAVLVTLVGSAVFAQRMSRLDRETAAISTGSPFVTTNHSNDGVAPKKPRPEASAYVPSPDRCPRFTPRTVATNGRGWRVYADRAHCLTVEYPKDWELTTVGDKISIVEPTGNEQGEYAETAYIGEMSGIVHITLSTADDWAPEQRGYARRNTTIYAKDVTSYYSAVASYRMLLPDRTIIDIDGFAPPKDAARIDTVKMMLRSIEVQDGADIVRLKPHVN